MTELLITLMNAPRLVQRSLALGILAIMIAAAVMGVTLLTSILLEKADRIDDMRAEVFRLDQIIARKPSDVSTPDLQVETGALFIEGSSLPAIQAHLQERVNTAASTAGAVVSSITGAAQAQRDGATYVGVRADMEGGLQAFHDVIRQLETSVPPLIIRQASIRSTNMHSQGQLSGPLQLAGQIMIYGAVDPAIALSENGQR